MKLNQGININIKLELKKKGVPDWRDVIIFIYVDWKDHIGIQTPIFSSIFSWALTKYSLLMWSQMATPHLIPATPVSKNSVTNKNSSVIFRKPLIFFLLLSLVGFIPVFLFNLFIYTIWQGYFEFCVFVFYYIGVDWSDHSLQHWVELWRPCFAGVWVVFSFCFHHDRCTLNG